MGGRSRAADDERRAAECAGWAGTVPTQVLSGQEAEVRRGTEALVMTTPIFLSNGSDVIHGTIVEATIMRTNQYTNKRMTRW